MRTRVAISLLCLTLLGALPAQAQYAVRSASDRATGENYHFEFGGFLWFPDPTLVIRSEALTQARIGSTIDLVQDFGFESKRFMQIKAVLRPGKKHKFRFEYTPIEYDNPSATLTRDIIFNGQRYTLSLPVAANLKWNAYRFAYEWDMIYRDRGFFGLILEAKYTDVQATLAQPALGL